MDPNAVFLELLATPVPKPLSAPPALKKATRQKAQRAHDDALVEAIEENDLAGVETALRQGADATLTLPRHGRLKKFEVARSLLDEALIRHGNVAMADLLQRAGAPATSQAWYGVTNHASVAMAEQLLAWGVPVPGTSGPQARSPMALFLNTQASAELLGWAMNQWGIDPTCLPKDGEYFHDVPTFLEAGTWATSTVRQAMNTQWGVDPSQPAGLATHCPSFASALQEVGERLVKGHRLTGLQGMIQSGWAPPDPVALMWAMVREEDWAALAWFRQVPALNEAFEAQGRATPERTWWNTGRAHPGLAKARESQRLKLPPEYQMPVPTWATQPHLLSHLEQLGWDPACPDAQGNLLAHHTLALRITDKEKRWWVEHHPELLVRPNAIGQCAQAHLDEALQRELSARLLAQSIDHGRQHAPDSLVSRKPRL